MTVNKDRVELLCQALESDAYRQCKRYLRQMDPYTGAWSHCALGVAIDVALANGILNQEKPGWFSRVRQFWNQGVLPPEVANWYGFHSTDPSIILEDAVQIMVDDSPRPLHSTSISSANDTGSSFWAIAQAIRARYLKDEG